MGGRSGTDPDLGSLRDELRRARDSRHGRVRPHRARFLAPTLTGALVAVFSIGVSMELWKAVQHPSGVLRGLLLPGLALQRVTTREPQLADTQVALRAVASVLRREL